MLLRTWRPTVDVLSFAPHVKIQSVRKPMRGGSQAYLVDGTDGNCYVAKFSGNPQGTRTLINEWICHRILQRLKICTPPLRILRLVECKSDLFLRFGSKCISVQPGMHLGSQCLVDPEKVPTFDFLPTKLFDRLENRADFLKMFVFDLFSGHVDRRQAIFVRSSSKKRELRFKAAVIDHGQAFAGSKWQVEDNVRSALYFDKSIYKVEGARLQIEATVQNLQRLTKEEFDHIIAQTPSDWWLEQDRREIVSLWDQLVRQQQILPCLVEEAIGQIGYPLLGDSRTRLEVELSEQAFCSETPLDLLAL